MNVQSEIIAAANRYGVDPDLALAVAQNESGFNQSAVSSAGAVGIMQLMPETASWLGVNPHDSYQNIDGGVRYLSQLLDQFGDPATAVAAYNMGPGAVQRESSWYPETQQYVSRVMADYGVGESGVPTFSTTVYAEPYQEPVLAGFGLDSSTTLLLLLAAAGVAVASRR